MMDIGKLTDGLLLTKAPMTHPSTVQRISTRAQPTIAPGNRIRRHLNIHGPTEAGREKLTDGPSSGAEQISEHRTQILVTLRFVSPLRWHTSSPTPWAGRMYVFLPREDGSS